MLRNSVAFITALYAIGFAFAALAAVRWPTLLMLVAFFGESASELNNQINWRELGLIYGLIYLAAAILFYTTSTLISQRKAGSVVTYLLAAGIGFPPFILFDFDAGWWQSPDLFEQSVLFAGFISLFLFSAVLELNRTRKSKGAELITRTGGLQQASHGDASAHRPLVLSSPLQMHPLHIVAPAPAPVRRRRKPVPAAILRQRQSFARHGRKANARRRR